MRKHKLLPSARFGCRGGSHGSEPMRRKCGVRLISLLARAFATAGSRWPAVARPNSPNCKRGGSGADVPFAPVERQPQASAMRRSSAGASPHRARCRGDGRRLVGFCTQSARCRYFPVAGRVVDRGGALGDHPGQNKRGAQRRAHRLLAEGCTMDGTSKIGEQVQRRRRAARPARSRSGASAISATMSTRWTRPCISIAICLASGSPTRSISRASRPDGAKLFEGVSRPSAIS